MAETADTRWSIRTARADLGSSFVGALATLPQAVAYGLIAVSPLGQDWAVLGIVAGVGASVLFGALSGAVSSNPFLVSGPRALTALVLATGLQSALSRGLTEPQAIGLAFFAVLAAGMLQFVAGVLRLGHIVSYVPVPVSAGFVNASALLVAIGAMPMVLGAPDLGLIGIVEMPSRIDHWAMAVGGTTIAVIFLMERFSRIVPAALAGLIAGTAVYFTGQSFFDVPSGPEVGYINIIVLFESPGLLLKTGDVTPLLAHLDIIAITAASIGMLAAFDTVLAGNALAMQTGHRSDANQDLRWHGALNMLSGACGLLPGSGALNRSSAVVGAGAESRAANIGTALVLLGLVTLLAPLVAVLPLWATAGMLVATSIQAIDQTTIQKVRGIVMRSVPYPRVLAGDVAVTLVVVVTGLLLNLIAAVAVGVSLAVLLFVLGMGRNPIRRTYLSSKVHAKVLRPARQMAVLEKEGERIAVIEIQGPLFFGACAQLQSQARQLISSGAQYIILDMRHMTSIDSTGASLVRSLAINCAEADGALLLSCVEPERRTNPVKRRRFKGRDGRKAPAAGSPRWVWLNMQANGVFKVLDEGRVFDETDTALAACEELLLERFGRLWLEGERGVIANSATFADMSRDQILTLVSYTKRHSFKPGEVVFTQGEQGDRAFFLVHGRVDVLIDIPGSMRRRRVSALTEGTVFAEMALIDGGVRSATVIAVRRTSCLSIDAESFNRLQHEKPDIALILMRNLSRQFSNRLRLANMMISELER